MEQKTFSFTSGGTQISHRASVLGPLLDLPRPVVRVLLQVLRVPRHGTGSAPAAAAAPSAAAPTGRLVVVDDREDHDVQEQQRTPDANGHGQGQREGRVAGSARAAVVQTVGRRRRPATTTTTPSVTTTATTTPVLVVSVLELSATVVVVPVTPVGR